jgi:hypothetical protein
MFKAIRDGNSETLDGGGHRSPACADDVVEPSEGTRTDCLYYILVSWLCELVE